MSRRNRTTLDSLQWVAEVLSALAVERGELRRSGSRIEVRIQNLVSSQFHIIEGSGTLDEGSGDVAFSATAPMHLDGGSVTGIQNLQVLGFDERQMQLLCSHVTTGAEIERSLADANSTPAALLSQLGQATERAATGNLGVLLGELAQAEAFALFDAVGNADGVPRNPIRHAMMGDVDGASSHHPIVKAQRDGLSEVVVVRGDHRLRTGGEIPPDIANELRELVSDENIDDVGFFHPYTYAVRQVRGKSDLREVARIPAVALMSKRSFVPRGRDFQIKTGFDGQITAHVRNIHFGEAHNAISNSHTIEALAQRKLLPAGTWIVPEFAWRGIPDDASTMAIIRGGLRHAISNGGRGIPANLRAVAASTLWSRNLIKPDRTLFEDLVEFGFDPAELHRSIVERVVTMFCDFVQWGVVPESHSQNLLYVFDLERREVAGLVLRDLADAHFAPSVLASAGIDYQGWYRPDLSDLVLSRLSDDQTKVRTKVAQQFSYVVLHLQVEPLSRFVSERFGYSFADLFAVACQAFWRWVEEHPAFPVDGWFDTDGYHVNERASVLLGVDGAGYVRKSPHFMTMTHSGRQQ